MPTTTKNTIIFDEKDWLGGLHPQSGEISPILFNGYDSMTGVNPFYSIGSITTGKSPIASVNISVVDGFIKNMLPNTSDANNVSGISLFGVGGTKLYEIDVLTGDLTSGAKYPHAVASSTMEDISIYKIDANESVLYSYNTASSGDIGFHDNYDTFNDTYWTTTLGMAALDKDKPHPMIVGDDDINYIGDGNVVKSIDGTVPSGNANALTLPTGFTIKSFSKYNNRTLVIFADQESGDSAGQINAYFWDYISKDPYRVYKIEGTKVGGASEYKGSVGVVHTGFSTDFENSNRDLHFSVFDGSRFKVLFTIEAGDVPSTGGISVMDDYVLFNSSGKLYSYGSPFDGVKAGAMCIQELNGGESGAVTRSLKNRVLTSSSDNADGRMELILSGFDNDGNFSTTFAEPSESFLNKSRVSKVRVEFKKVSTGGRALDLWLKDEAGNNIKVLNALEEVSDLKQVFYSNTFTTEEFSFFNSIQIYANWGTGSGSNDAPVIRRVIVEYENVAITN